MDLYEHTSLWKNAFDAKDDEFDKSRTILVTAYQEFRGRVALLLQQIQKELPSLTLHDITHVDSLWRVASEIAGPDFDLNPAEAFVLGGAFLLHDAAHCRAAFPGGLAELQQTTEWKDTAAQRGLALEDIQEGSEEFQIILFDTLRVLHPKQARKLPFAYWLTGADGANLHLLPQDELRDAYGHLIGEIAESHWWHPHELEFFAYKNPAAPPFLAPANWTVDMLKVAALLRTADAAHIDAMRAPRFLMVMNQPQGISKEHWLFQARLNQPKCASDRNELVFSSSPFPENELSAWWLAFDSACLANKELAAADLLLRDNQRPYRFAARSVAGTYSPEAFSTHVPTDGWHPVDTSIKITDIKSVVERFGGEKLYGDNPSAALRELLQNAVDAVHACRALGGLGAEEGEIEVFLEDAPEGHWLHVTDTGIGMSRYVLTEVLLDFGCSLWRSADLRGEWSGLSASGFDAIGQFGIGFFSVFMLGEQVRVVSRRFEQKEGEAAQWLLDFCNGISKRPILRVPVGSETLKRHGTRVSVLISSEKLGRICTLKEYFWSKGVEKINFVQACARLAPAIGINLYVNTNLQRQLAVSANDWLTLKPLDIIQRIAPGYFEKEEKFGPWSHFSELLDEKGRVVGRCAACLSLYRKPALGVGVVKGLLAGTVGGIAGIVNAKPQKDLARTEAIPDTTLNEVQTWAERQKALLLAQTQLRTRISGLLAFLGASYANLILGALGGEPVSYEALISWLSEQNRILQHNGDVDYDEDDDAMSRRDFEDNFVQHEFLLELAEAPRPDWLDAINHDKVSLTAWSLDTALNSALEEAWGRVEWSERTEAVGEANGTEIIRKCYVAERFTATAS